MKNSIAIWADNKDDSNDVDIDIDLNLWLSRYKNDWIKAFRKKF